MTKNIYKKNVLSNTTRNFNLELVNLNWEFLLRILIKNLVTFKR